MRSAIITTLDSENIFGTLGKKGHWKKKYPLRVKLNKRKGKNISRTEVERLDSMA